MFNFRQLRHTCIILTGERCIRRRSLREEVRRNILPTDRRGRPLIDRNTSRAPAVCLCTHACTHVPLTRPRRKDIKTHDRSTCQQADHQATDPESAAEEVKQAYKRITDEVHKVIVGQDEVIEQLLTCMFCGGHSLVVGVPGLAKTLLISTLARTMSLGFSRIQFTPDLMPSDMTGTEVIEEDKTTGARELRFVKGPIFSNVILADEINRTPPKTQAALLEAMQERQVTAGGVRHALPRRFSYSPRRTRSNRKARTHCPKRSSTASCSTSPSSIQRRNRN
jgi:hypothetical protein